MSADAGAGAGATAFEGQLSGADWRAYRAWLIETERAGRDGLVTSSDSAAPSTEWAHEVPCVEVGSCLVANRRYKWPKSFEHLDSAVVLVTDVAESGLTGLLLTRPSNYFVGDQESVYGRVGREFKENIVHLGGDCSMGSLEVLHKFSPAVCAGARELVPGLSLGGFNASRRLVQSGLASAHDFHFFIAYAKLTWPQLKAELDNCAWITVACSPNLLLHSSLEDPCAEKDSLWQRIMSHLD